MKNVTMKMVKAILVAGMAVTTMIGCADNNKDNGARVRTAGNGVLPFGQQGQYGMVTGTASITQDVANILGGASQTQLGTVNPTGSIYMGGKVYFPNGQNMNSTNSYIAFQIYDSFALSGQGQPIIISVGNNNMGTGTVTMTSPNSYNADITFRDQAGTITLRGQAVTGGGNFTGTIYYTMSSGVQGTLGQFTIPTCQFFNCQ